MSTFNMENVQLPGHVRQSIQMTREEICNIAKAPQRSPLWFQARSHRLTASNFGSAVGHNPYTNPDKLLATMLWNIKFPSNAATEYGTVNEDKARNLYMNYRRQFENIDHLLSPETEATKKKLTVEEYNLLIPLTLQYFGFSPDGIVWENGKPFLMEIKCTYSRKFYGRIPLYYYDQITGAMALSRYIPEEILNNSSGSTGLPFCDFVVMTPNYTCVQRYTFNETYWDNLLFPKMTEWYFQRYIPRVIMKDAGQLKEGHIDPVFDCNSDDENDNDEKKSATSRLRSPPTTKSKKRKLSSECPFVI